MRRTRTLFIQYEFTRLEKPLFKAVEKEILKLDKKDKIEFYFFDEESLTINFRLNYKFYYEVPKHLNKFIKDFLNEKN